MSFNTKLSMVMVVGGSLAVGLATAETIVIEQNGLQFSPSMANAAPGDTVVFTWTSSTHTATSGGNCEYSEYGDIAFDEFLSASNPVVTVEIPINHGHDLVSYFCDMAQHCEGAFMRGTISIYNANAAPGDYNGDNSVNGADLGQLLSAWGSSIAHFDLNDDGIINGADLGVFLSNWTG